MRLLPRHRLNHDLTEALKFIKHYSTVFGGPVPFFRFLDDAGRNPADARNMLFDLERWGYVKTYWSQGLLIEVVS